jgi:DNA-directed RNA polymerase subunit A'
VELVVIPAKCPGHFGHIELAEPVLHIAFVDDIPGYYSLPVDHATESNSREELDKCKLIRETKAYAVITLEYQR